MAGVEQRHDLVLDRFECGIRLATVAAIEVGIVVERRDVEAVVAVGHLVPPAVTDRAVEPTVEGRLHARRATGLHRAARRVQPDIAPVVHRSGDPDVVVRDEHESVSDISVAGQAVDLTDQRLAGLVGGVGLAGEHELDGSVGVEQHRAKPVELGEQQGRTLVGGETPSESDRQDAGIEQRTAEPIAHDVDEFAPAFVAHVPDLSMIEVLYTFPVALVGEVPLVADHLRQQLVDSVAHPGAGVDTVGDVADRNLGRGEARPEVAEHLPRDLAVQAGDAVRVGGQTQPHDRHVELVVLGLALADGDQLVDRDVTLGSERREVPLDQITREPVDAGGHRRVRREQAAGAHRLDRLVEAQPSVDPFPDPFESEEAGMAFVGVEHLRMNVERSQCPHAADAEDDLLAQTMLFVAAVEPVGDGDGLRRVRWHVRVEQVQPDPADVGAPHSHRHGNVGEVDDDFDAGWMQPECVGIDALVALLLPAVVVEELMEVALGVEQTDADERNAEIGRRLQVVAGEHAEAAGVLRDGLGDAELGREVGDRLERRVAVGGAAGEPARAVECVVEALLCPAELLDELLVVGQRLPTGGRGAPNQIDGMLARVAPRTTVGGPVEAIEQASQLPIPGPVKVGGQRFQRSERFGNVADDGEVTNGAHRTVTIPTCRRALDGHRCSFMLPSPTWRSGSGRHLWARRDDIVIQV